MLIKLSVAKRDDRGRKTHGELNLTAHPIHDPETTPSRAKNKIRDAKERPEPVINPGGKTARDESDRKSPLGGRMEHRSR